MSIQKLAVDRVILVGYAHAQLTAALPLIQDEGSYEAAYLSEVFDWADEVVESDWSTDSRRIGHDGLQVFVEYLGLAKFLYVVSKAEVRIIFFEDFPFYGVEEELNALEG